MNTSEARDISATSSKVECSPIHTASSKAGDAQQAALELWQELDATTAACVIFFCSSDYDLKLLATSLSELSQGVPVVGCTTAGEISPCGMTQSTITALSLPAEQFVVETILFNKLASFSADQAFNAVKEKVKALESRAIAGGAEHSFALSLLDGMSIREELVLKSLNEALNGIPLVGGSAGDNLNFGDTYVYYDGVFYNNAAVMILVNTICPFEVMSNHHFVADSEKLVVTQADPVNRIAQEFNAEPAALEYCRIMGLSLDELNSRTFAMHPLAVHVGENLYVRSIQQLNDDLSLTFFCAIDTGVVLSKAHDAGMITHFKNMMLDVGDSIGEPQIIVGYNCIHRCIEAEGKNLTKELSQLYKQHRVIGFNTYGEQCNGVHMNHSFTGVAIGLPDCECNE